jgi:DNA-binding GntR family transcriptional regulator
MVAAARRVQHGPMGSPCRSSATQAHGPAELRTLIELAALRKLADRGLTDTELSVSRRLARATARSARGGDLCGYLESDAAFHLYLVGLAGDPVRSEVARLLLGTGGAHWPTGGIVLSAWKPGPASMVRSSLFSPMTWSARPARC